MNFLHLLIVLSQWVFVLGDETGNPRKTHIEANWDFENDIYDSEGWARSTSQELGANIRIEAGELRGEILPRQQKDNQGILTPHFDSPIFHINVTDRHYIVIRMKYNGPRIMKGRVAIRMHSSSNWKDHQMKPSVSGRNDWLNDHTTVFVDFNELEQGASYFAVDWIRVAKAPVIYKVEGCIDKYFENDFLAFGRKDNRSALITSKRDYDGYFVYRAKGGGHANITTHENYMNDDKHLFYSTSYAKMEEMPYATTYNCLREGGEVIRITGTNLGVYYDASIGVVGKTITVDGQVCTNAKMLIEQKQIECTLPKTLKSGPELENVQVKVIHPEMPGLFDQKPFLSYMIPPPKPLAPTISNIATHAITLSWVTPTDFWDAMTITGYIIKKQNMMKKFSKSEIVYVLGNVTTTTIIGLDANTEYTFSIAAIAENQKAVNEKGEFYWKQLDLYGRREKLTGAVIGTFSDPTPVVSTLGSDFVFTKFDANSTLSHGPIDSRSTVSPSKNVHGEGHYGLVLVGDANIENCNTSCACCDGFGTNAGCGTSCTNIRDIDLDYENGVSKRNVSTNRQKDGITIGALPPDQEGVFYNITSACGPALRLTPSVARTTGAAWYPRKMNVREGFETTFTFRISNPSLVCMSMNDVQTNCRSRGADGFAFVIQNNHELSLGAGGVGMGYDGIENAIAIEFDTFFNPDKYDPYENHVALIAKKWDEKISSHHNYEVGGSSGTMDLTDESFKANAYLERFLGGFGAEGGSSEPLWSTGMGTISVFIENMQRPIFISPLNLAQTLRLHSGRAWVGFTAATGDSFFQVHDILDWTFTSKREDI